VRKIWPWLATGIVPVAAAVQLHRQGRLWLCSCGYLLPWAGDIWSSDNSQHLFDPYSFTHLLHGFLFSGLLAWGVPRVSAAWRLCLAVSLEAMWEVIENSDFIIRRYREATASLSYQGDTIVNSLGDILVSGLGVMLAWHLGFRRALALFAVIEVPLLLWIRDSLILNMVMLIYPMQEIKVWQMGH